MDNLINDIITEYRKLKRKAEDTNLSYEVAFNRLGLFIFNSHYEYINNMLVDMNKENETNT